MYIEGGIGSKQRMHVVVKCAGHATQTLSGLLTSSKCVPLQVMWGIPQQLSARQMEHCADREQMPRTYILTTVRHIIDMVERLCR